MKPVKLPDYPDVPARCGRCPACMARRRMEWANRMLLEQYSKNYKPLFVTATYKPGKLPKNYNESTKEVQKYLKRLRRALPENEKLRYFSTTENGSKKGRIHNHLIIWSEYLSKLPIQQQWELQHQKWGLGRYQSEPIRSPAGFNYVAKYMVKNLTNEETGKWSRYDGQYQNDGRLFTYSQRPMLGYPGIERWKYLIKQLDAYNIWKKTGKLPPNYFNGHIFGRLKKLYVPSDVYKKTCKNIGISFTSKNVSHILALENFPREFPCQRNLIELTDNERLLQPHPV